MLINRNTIIFDFDGTLVDTMQIFADVASQLIFKHYGLEREAARQKYFETSGLPFHSQLEIIFSEHELNKKIAAIYEDRKLKETADVEMDSDTREALHALKERGYGLGISSNNFQTNVENFVNKNKLEDLFFFVLGHKENFSKGKEHFDFALNQAGMEREKIVFVGDSINDARLAMENGISFIARLGTFGEKDFHAFDKDIFCINKISDLIKLIYE